MRLERLVVASGGRTLAIDLQPGLTVIGGLEPTSREALAGELLDSLAGARPGVHLVLELGGRHLAVFRPAGGRHRVIDTGSVADVTAAHAGAGGEIDLFAALGVDGPLARRTLRFGRDDLVMRSESEAWIGRLAAADQERLWDTAMRGKAAEQLLDQAAAGGVGADDAPIVRDIEEKHAALVEATDTYERIRLLALTISTVGALGAVGVAGAGERFAALPFVLVALAGLILALRYRRAVTEAERAERSVLRRAGADDYTSFHYERVSALLDTDRERRRFMQAVGDHRRAMEAWAEVAGPVPLRFALEHEQRIRAAAELHASVVDPGAPGGDARAHPDVDAELVSAVLARMQAVRALTGGTEVLPLIVDDPFEGFAREAKEALLRLLAARAVDQQVVVLTGDPDVAAWARAAAEAEVAEASITVEAGEVPGDAVPARR